MSNIYSKLQKARCEFQNTSLKKSGHNKFAGYKYFELSDIMPTINALLDKHNLCSQITFYSDHAELNIYNSENSEEKITFNTPNSSANLKGCHEVQNLGAVQTYLRRYLWVAAFEIVEGDGLDATTGKDKKSNSKDNPVLEPLRNLIDIARTRNVRDADMFKAMSIRTWKEFDNIPNKEGHLQYAIEHMSELVAAHHVK